MADRIPLSPRTSLVAPYISQADWNYVFFMSHSVLVYTDCADFPNFNIPFQSSTQVSDNDNPMERVDIMYVNPSSSGIYGSIAGVNAIGCSNGTGYVVPTYQQVRIRPASGSYYGDINYVDLNNPNYLSGYPDYSKWNKIVGNSDVVTLSNFTSGTYVFQYRNSSTNTFSSSGKGLRRIEETWIFY